MIIRYFRWRKACQRRELARKRRALRNMKRIEEQMWEMYIHEPDAGLAADLVLDLHLVGRIVRQAERQLGAST